MRVNPHADTGSRLKQTNSPEILAFYEGIQGLESESCRVWKIDVACTILRLSRCHCGRFKMRTLDRTEELTVSEYQHLIEAGIIQEDERVELWEGYLRDMSPVGAKHSAMVRTVVRVFNRVFNDQYLVNGQDPIVLSDRTQPQPDVTLLRLQEDNYITYLPTVADVVLLVEVSDSTLAFDLGVKVPRYAKAGIPEVWIIDTNALTLTQFQTPQDEIYTEARTYQRGDTITTLGATFSVSDLLR